MNTIEIPASALNRSNLTETTLSEIQQCSFSLIPKIIPESTILKPREYAFVEIPAMFIKEDGINQEFAKGNTGKSFRLARGIEYKIGEKKSKLLLESSVSPPDKGFLIITNRRLIFSGMNGVSAEIAMLFGTRIFEDSIQFATIKSEKLITIGFEENLDAEYCGVILAKVLNN